MSNYEKPVISSEKDLSEGIFLASGSGNVSANRVSSEYKHSAYWEVKYNFTFPSEYQGKHVKVEVHFAGNVFTAWSKHEREGERTLANNVLTFQDHTVNNNNEYDYYVGVQSKESEAACNITGIVVTPM